MNYPFQWWQNRKSRLGMQVSAKKPPHQPGKEWWTTPPTTLPQPEHIEYVAGFVAQLQSGTDRPAYRNAMLKYCGDWMKAAKRLLHEEAQAPGRADLHTTDGIIVAACRALYKMRARIYGLGGVVDGEVVEIMDAVQGRAAKIRRERAMESAKTAQHTTSDAERGAGR